MYARYLFIFPGSTPGQLLGYDDGQILVDFFFTRTPWLWIKLPHLASPYHTCPLCYTRLVIGTSRHLMASAFNPNIIYSPHLNQSSSLPLSFFNPSSSALPP